MAGNAIVSIEVWLIRGTILNVWVFLFVLSVIILQFTNRDAIVGQVGAVEIGLICSICHFDCTFVSIWINCLLGSTGDASIRIIAKVCSVGTSLALESVVIEEFLELRTW